MNNLDSDSATSYLDLDLYCLQMSLSWDASHYWVHVPFFLLKLI